MGPTQKDLRKMLRDDLPDSPPPVRSPNSGSGAPPASMFAKKPAVSTPSTVNDSFESTRSTPSPRQLFKKDPAAIRQEALKVLEVAENTNSGYAVHRTTTGGFSATKRTPAALKSLSFAAAGRTRRYRDNEEADGLMKQPAQDDYEYADESVVDVVHMDRRAMASRPVAESESKWSSRYSVNNTLLNLSGGNTGGKLLDRMDRSNNLARQNLLGSHAPKVFGSGFSFRERSVFGKQNVVAKQQHNLQTAWNGSSTSNTAASRSKSWQEQLEQKRRQRRMYVIGALLVAVLIVAASVLGHHHVTKNAASDHESVTFYITSGDPYYLNLDRIGDRAEFLVHLGNVDESVTCSNAAYDAAARELKQSSVVTFVVPGEDDINNCPDPESAERNWLRSFHFFHRNFDHSMDVMSENVQNENFAFVEGGVLFLGMHVVGGDETGDEEQITEYDQKWLIGMTNSLGKDVRAIVVLANADPNYSLYDDFFSRMDSFLEDKFPKPVAYVHASRLDGKNLIYNPFDNQRITAIQLGYDSDAEETPVLRLTVGFGDEPFVVG